MHSNAKYWIDHLDLKPHPEGGHYNEVYRSAEVIEKNSLPKRYGGKRSFSTSIYFLLQKDKKSAFHRIKSDETWYYHDGGLLEIIVLDETGTLTKNILGLDVESGAQPQLTILMNRWFAARSLSEFTLVSCSVSPGFDFDDFELGDYLTMAKKYPQHEHIFKRFCL